MLVGIAVAGGCALGAFLLANPYALLDFQRFHSELVHQSSLSEEAQGKLGAPKQGGSSTTCGRSSWGLGWAPALAALGGTVAIWRRDARIGWLLVPAPLLFLGFMGLQDRYFGRWLLPIFPDRLFARGLLRARATWRGSTGKTEPSAARSARTAFVAVLLLAQASVQRPRRPRAGARRHAQPHPRVDGGAHPRDARIVLEPVVLGSWLRDGGHCRGAPRWAKYPALNR